MPDEVSTRYSDSELEAYVDELLDPARAAEIKQSLKSDSNLLRRLSYINGRRDAGVHSLGEIWRQNQIGVPPRELVEKWIGGKVSKEQSDYLQFRLDQLRCRFTAAIVQEVHESVEGNTADIVSRRKKIFESSQKLLKPKRRRRE